MLYDGYKMKPTDAQEELEEVQTDLRKREDEVSGPFWLYPVYTGSDICYVDPKELNSLVQVVSLVPVLFYSLWLLYCFC